MNSLTSIKNAITDLPKNFDGESYRPITLLLFCTLDNVVIGRYNIAVPLTSKKFMKRINKFTAKFPHIVVLIQPDDAYLGDGHLSALQWVVIDQQWDGLERNFIDGLVRKDMGILTYLEMSRFDNNRHYRKKFLESFPAADIADSTFTYIYTALA